MSLRRPLKSQGLPLLSLSGPSSLTSLTVSLTGTRWLTRMEGPKCKLCGERHWGMCESYRSAEASSRPSVRSADGPTPVDERSPLAEEGKLSCFACGRRRNRRLFPPRFDGVKYQREYMRKWRAARKPSK
jgi:hypothetical protein